MTFPDSPAVDVVSMPSAAGAPTDPPWRRNQPWVPSEAQRRAIDDCRTAHVSVERAEANYRDRIEEAIALGVLESRLSLALGMSDAAIRMARKRRKRRAS